MRIKRVTHVQVDSTPVYDITVPNYENFALANGVVVHNCKAARLSFQGVLPLKGKPMNAIKAKGNAALESEEIIHILGAIGFDANASDPYEKLQTGKIICLADPDPDGPLAGSTRVMTLDGIHTIESLAEKWIKDHKPFKVHSIDGNGCSQMGVASNPRRVCFSDTTYTLHFDNGTNVECTSKHKWVPNKAHAKQVLINEISFVETRDLTIGDELKSTGASHTIVKIDINERNQKPMYCLTVEKYGNFMIDDGLGNGICSSNCLVLQISS